MGVEFEELSSKIIHSAIEVHKKVGPGFMESIYEKALCIELSDRSINFEQQKEVKIYYNRQEVGLHRIDLVVEGEIIIELKAVKDFNDTHFAQLRSYLKATRLRVGLLLNFAKSKLEIKRIVN